MHRILLFVAVLLGAAVLVPSLATAAPAADARQPVYFGLADSLSGSVDDASHALQGAFAGAGWTVVGAVDASGGPNCPYHARVLLVIPPGHAAAVLSHGPLAAFALPLRVLVYQDEAGTHLAAVNPMSIDRTIVAESGFEAASAAALQGVEHIAREALHVKIERRPYGQWRERGLIGRTMGIMAGGPFPDKVKTLWSTPGNSARDVAQVADRVWAGLQGSGAGKWQMHGVYRYDLPDEGVVLLGVTGAAMEAKSFAIVGAAGDGRRSHDRCPGLDHAAAYPIEVVVYREKGAVRVATIDGMYRMKVYFEDAGKMKFAANMGMPGSIEDEIRALVLSAVGAKP